jgi:esterase/lipase superfamily enzyme
MTTVYFATNRKPDPTAAGGFGSAIAANQPDAITYAVADVTGIALAQEGSGTIAGISSSQQGVFSDAATSAIIGARKNLLVFVHGFDNSFEDAITRAAYNREWLAASGQAAADTTVVAFTWPSAGNLVAPPPHLPVDAYLNDQAQAGKSGFHLAFFLNVIDQLRADYKKANPNGRVFLLAHSMGNYVLQSGIQFWFDNRGSADLMFDEIFLPGADEIFDSFERPNGARLSNLPKLTNRISLYHSRKDIAMFLSTTVNLSSRLGFDGPDDKRDPALYPPARSRTLDCTEVADFDLASPPDATYQYYRRSKIVRADIVAAMAGNPNPAGGLITLGG